MAGDESRLGYIYHLNTWRVAWPSWEAYLLPAAGTVWQVLLRPRRLIKYSVRLIVLPTAFAGGWVGWSFIDKTQLSVSASVPPHSSLFLSPNALTRPSVQKKKKKKNFCMIPFKKNLSTEKTAFNWSHPSYGRGVRVIHDFQFSHGLNLKQTRQRRSALLCSQTTNPL